MSDVVRLHGLGAAVDVHLTGDASPAMAAAMRPAWTRCLAAQDPAGRSVEAEPLTVRLDDRARLAGTLMVTTQRVTRALISARGGHLLMFHAGAVSHPGTGRSLVYVAAGGTGKTTLSLLLGQQLGYLTDETVGVDDTGVIHPYPKPLSVRRADEPRLKDEVSPDALGLVRAPARPTVGRVVVLDRDPAPGRAELDELPFMDALFAVVAHTSALPSLPRPLQQLAELLDRTGPVLRLRYSEAPDAARCLSRLIGGLA